MNRDANAPDDADLDALFAAAATRRSGPPALDESVRAEAHAAASSGVRSVVRGTPDDTSVPTSGPTDKVASVHRPAPRWLAAAAVLVFAAALVPLVRQAPEPAESLDTAESAETSASTASIRSTVAFSPADTSSAEPLAEPSAGRTLPSDSRSATAADESDISRSLRSTSRARATDAEPAAESDASPSDASLALSPQLAEIAPSTTEDAADAKTSRVDSTTEAAPDRWLVRLVERLEEEGVTDSLRDEYARFRARYPDVTPGPELERALGDGARRTDTEQSDRMPGGPEGVDRRDAR